MHPANRRGLRGDSTESPQSHLGLLRRVACQISVTIVGMPVLGFIIDLLEIMFFVGLAGSSIVVLISFFEDGKELFGED